MSSVDLDDLERKARAATPGPWRFGDWSAIYGTVENPDHMLVLERNMTAMDDQTPYRVRRSDGRYEVLRLEEPPTGPNADHIAANSPDVTLALIAELRELRKMRDGLAALNSDLQTDDLPNLRAAAQRIELLLAATKEPA